MARTHLENLSVRMALSTHSYQDVSRLACGNAATLQQELNKNWTKIQCLAHRDPLHKNYRNVKATAATNNSNQEQKDSSVKWELNY